MGNKSKNKSASKKQYSPWKRVKNKYELIKKERYWLIPSVIILCVISGYLFGLKPSPSDIFSVVLGGILTYFSSSFLKKQEIKENAYTSAILIRSWLHAMLDEIVNFKEQVKYKQEKLLTINDATFITYNNESREAFIIATMDFFKNKNLYEFDMKLIKDITLVRNKLVRYEEIPQKLAIALNKYGSIELIKEKFNEFKRSCDISKPRDFCIQLNIFFDDYIDMATKKEQDLKAIFNYFQTTVCTPLNIPPIELGTEPINQDEIIAPTLS